MPRPAPRKTSRQPGGLQPRRRPVAGARTRRPVGEADASGPADGIDTDPTDSDRTDSTSHITSSSTSLTKDRTSKVPSPRPSPRPKPSPAKQRVPERRAPPRPAGRVVTALIAAAVVLAIAVGILGWLRWQQARTDAARSDALAAARSHAQSILSYDYRKIDADIAKGKRATIGKFRDEYAKTTSTVVKPTALQYKAVVSAEVRAASVRSVTPQQVVIVLFVNQTTTSNRISGPKVDQSRVRMTLVKRDDTWLVSKIDAL